MKRIDDLFVAHRARSDIFRRYRAGPVPYVGNGLSDNAVLGLVTPLPRDKIFDFTGITVSAFCEATLQAPPFIACGRAGNGLLVLQPREAMKIAELAYYAAYINIALHWRFSWYWQTTADRIKRLPVPDGAPSGLKFSIREHMPKLTKPAVLASNHMRFRLIRLGAIFDLKGGDYHSLNSLPAGTTPVVSCGDLDNGVCGYFGVGHVYRDKMTIAFNGSTLSAKYHPYEFAAKDDVAVCFPKTELKLPTLLFIQLMLAREQWRFSYYRKCYKEKLERVSVPLPTLDGGIDENAIEDLMKTTPYWEFLKGRLET